VTSGRTSKLLNALAFVKPASYDVRKTEVQLEISVGKRHISEHVAKAVVAVGLHLKLQKEEKFMTEQFSAQYADHKREVKSLIPFVY
jgi:hypothetical protein